MATESAPDFAFLYLGDVDECGHAHGWMTEAYLTCLSRAIDCVKRMFEKFGETYRTIIMADHGGHDRTHGTLMAEDMTIPFFFCGPEFTPGEISAPVSLLALAPTIAKLLGIAPDSDWEGHAII